MRDVQANGLPGTSVERAYRELLASREPARTVVVAVIDGGVDTAHVDLKDNLWRNARETPGNGTDDDGNGFVDDVHGWNFLGNVEHDRLEVTRLYAQCSQGGATGPAQPLQCDVVNSAYQKERAEAEQILGQVRNIDEALSFALPALRTALGTDSLSVERVQALRSDQRDVQQARSIYLQLAANGISPKDVEDAKEEYQSQLDYKLNPTYDPRATVGDNPADLSERVYGSADVMGPDATHGTHVAGIIAAARGNGVGIDGIASRVQIMAVRVVPDGDEHDKDVANGIRYAVDNGAQIINMSFGKAFSPHKSVVDEAVKYAESKGVLLIHAAGNDGEDLGEKPSFPTRSYQAGGSAANWIEVGASSWKVDSLATSFSNYGRAQVDLFAPGLDILSTVPGGGFERQDGTSMAAPVVTGIAALLMSYFPELKAADVKRILLASVTPYGDRNVARPGSGQPVRFGELSATGGVVNAFAAIRMAAQMRPAS
jgi:subtilisin family serine protease